MRKIRETKDYFEGFVSRYEAFAGCVFAVNQENAVKRLSSKSGVQLLVTYPAAQGEGGNDNGVMTQSLLVFVLEKGNSQSATAEGEFEQFAKLQDLLLDLIEDLNEQHSTGNPLFYRLQRGETTIEAEYNLTGWNGWGATVVL